MRKHANILTLFVLTIAVLLASAKTAAAAAQALALVATTAPVPLACAGADCAAELSAFCLEPHQRSPESGAAYRLAATDAVRIVGHTADGREVSLGTDGLAITALRTHVAVRVAVPSRRVQELGLTEIAVAVDPGATLLPAAAADRGARSESELALLTGPLRTLGSRLVDGDDEQMAAARIAVRMINMLPAVDREGAADRAGVWPAIARSDVFARLSPMARALARQTHDTCLRGARNGPFPSMRQCLESHHDMLLGGLNKAYWDALKTGS